MPRWILPLLAMALLAPAAAAPGPVPLVAVAITFPADGADVEGVVVVRGTASDENGVTNVHLRVDSGPFEAVNMQGNTEVTWDKQVDTTGLVNGAHTLTARARSAGGDSVTHTITVHVANGLDTDLLVESLRGDTGLGGRTTLHLVAANAGGPALPGVDVRFEYSYKGTWRLIADARLDLPAYGNASLTQAWESLTKLGAFPVRATLDPANKVREVDEGNNGATATAAFWTDLAPGVDVLEPAAPSVRLPPTPSARHNVLILGTSPSNFIPTGGAFDTFGPHVLVARVGDRVTWTNAAPDGLVHTATRLHEDEAQFDTGTLAPGATSEDVLLDTAGIFQYYCKFHASPLPARVRSMGVLVILPDST